MSAILGWIGLAMCLFIAALIVFYNVVVIDNVFPVINGNVWGALGDGGHVKDLQQHDSMGYMMQWGRFIIPAALIVFGVAIWYVECVVYGRSDRQ